MNQHASQLANQTMELSRKAVGHLERWDRLFQEHILEAEEKGLPFELKEFVAFTAAVERLLKVAKLAAAMSQDSEGDGLPEVDDELLEDSLAE